MQTTYTIHVYDMPIKFTKKDGTTIGIDDPTRSTITDSANNTYKLTEISICKPLNSSNNTFDIIFQYKDNSTNPKFVYIQVPLKIQNVDVDDTNAQLIEFMEYVNSTANNASMNLSEIFDTLTNSTTYSVNNTNNTVIQYKVIYLNINEPSTAKKLFTNLKEESNITVNPLNIKPAPRNYRKTRDYNPESRDPTRTLPIEVYDNNNKTPINTTNKDNIKEEITTNLQIYTTLMIFGIVLGFIIVTLYVIIILIPDSKLRITRLPKPKTFGGGGWSFRKMWNYLRR
jgi:hypothetical protein